jgi:hypothetical protein
MNLTYGDEGYVGAEQISSMHAAVVAACCATKKIAAVQGVPVSQLDGFFSDLVNTVKTSFVRTNLFPLTLSKALVTGGPSGALQAIKNEGHAAAADIAPIGKPIGAVVSIFNPVVGGAIVAASTAAQADVARQKKAADALAQAGSNNAALIAQYTQFAGSVPGRAFGLDAMRAVMNAAFDQGAIPAAMIDGKGTRKVWGDMAADFILSSGGKCYTSKYSCPDGLLPLAKANPNAGAAQLVDLYAQSNPIHAPDLRGGLERQIFIDAADAALAQVNPNAPLTYGVDTSQAAQPAPVQVNLPAPSPTQYNLPGAMATGPLGPVDGQGVPLSLYPKTPAAQSLTQAGVNPQTSDQVNQMLAAMQAQGASQQQMLAAALQALQSQGINTSSPSVQQAASADVAHLQTAGISSVPSWLLPVLGVGAIVLALGMPRGSGKSNRAAFRARNPRRRTYRRR